MVGVAAKVWGPERVPGAAVEQDREGPAPSAPCSEPRSGILIIHTVQKQSWAERHAPQKAVSIGLSEHFPGSFISLCLLVSNEEAERRESQQTPSCWDFFIFSSGF